MREPAQPLVHRGKSLLEQLLRIAQTRLELLSAEVHQEKLALLYQGRLAAGAQMEASLQRVQLAVTLAKWGKRRAILAARLLSRLKRRRSR
jgi:hypothetical protein